MCRRASRGWLSRTFNRGIDSVIEVYGRSLEWVLRHERATLLVTALTLVATVWLYVIAPKGFLPTQDTGLITAIVEAEPQVSFTELSRIQKEVADDRAKDPAVSGVVSIVGIGKLNATPNVGNLKIILKPRDERDQLAAAIVDRLKTAVSAIPGVTVYFQPVQDVQIATRLSRAQYQYTLVSTDAGEVAQWSKRLASELAGSPVLRDVNLETDDAGLRARIEVDRETAGRLGITLQAVTDALNDAFGQRQVSTIYAQANQYRVVLEAMPEYRSDPSQLARLYVPSRNGAQVPLTAIAKIEHTTAPLSVSHQDQFPSETISFNLAPHAALSDAVAAIAAAETKIAMPSSVTGSFFGDANEFSKSLASQPWLILAAIVTIYIVLGVLYESFVHPFTILTTLPSAGIGALLALEVTGLDLSLVALIGIVLLMGIVKKNAIMMIDFALEAERVRGLDARRSIVEAALLRFRPITMTTLAALLGALPLALEIGHRLGAAQSAGHHHRRRPAAEPASHPLHDAGHLSRHGAAADALSQALQSPLSPTRPPSSAMSFSRPFIVRPIGTALLAAGLFLLGATAYVHLPVASLPAVDFPTVRVQASRPGADPATMAATIAAPLERRLGEIAGVTELTSESSQGSTRISVQFDLTRNIDGAARDVQAALNAASADLPGDLPQVPTFRKANPSASPVLILAMTSKTLSPSQLYDAADTVAGTPAARGRNVVAGAQEVGIGEEKLGRDESVPNQTVCAVEIRQDDVEKRRTLDDRAFDVLPFVRVDRERHEVERPGPGAASRVSVYVVGDTVRLNEPLPGLPAPRELLVAHASELCRQSSPMPARMSRRVERFIPVPSDWWLVLPLGGARRLRRTTVAHGGPPEERLPEARAANIDVASVSISTVGDPALPGTPDFRCGSASTDVPACGRTRRTERAASPPLRSSSRGACRSCALLDAPRDTRTHQQIGWPTCRRDRKRAACGRGLSGASIEAAATRDTARRTRTRLWCPWVAAGASGYYT